MNSVKKGLKIAFLLALLALAGIQFSRPHFNNPPIVKGQRLEDFHVIPAEVSETLARSCADCHSNNTNYPWYSGIAPLSWGMYDHIRVGRAEMNFSEWGSYSAKKREHKLEEICEQIEDGEMPHYQYLWLHWDAALSAEQKRLICSWTESVRKKDFGQIERAKKES